jgi:hypothetical protein
MNQMGQGKDNASRSTLGITKHSKSWGHPGDATYK